MIIEKMNYEDISSVVKIQKELVPFEINMERAEEVYKQIINNDDYEIIVAKNDSEILGTITLICCKALTGNFLVIEDVVVREDVRGKGIGKKLIAQADIFAKNKNCNYAILVSSGFRTKAHRFYYNCGFIDDVKGFRKVYN